MSQHVRREDRAQSELTNVKGSPDLQDSKDQRNRPGYMQRTSVSVRPKITLRRNRWSRAGSAGRRRTVKSQHIVAGICGLSILVLALVMVIVFGKSAVPVSKNEEDTSLRENDKVVSINSGAQIEQKDQIDQVEQADQAEQVEQVEQIKKIQGLPEEVYETHPDWTEDFLTPNEYSRPGDPLEQIDNIFVHYTANPGTSAAQNRSYFEQQKDVHKSSVSAHFIIGYEGEILQCIPLDEIAYAVQTRNMDSISIECCHLEADGSFTQETYDSLISLLAWLVDAYDLETDDILRHYDCGRKKCPLYYTEHPDAWEQLKQDVKDMREDS